MLTQEAPEPFAISFEWALRLVQDDITKYLKECLSRGESPLYGIKRTLYATDGRPLFDYVASQWSSRIFPREGVIVEGVNSEKVETDQVNDLCVKCDRYAGPRRNYITQNDDPYWHVCDDGIYLVPGTLERNPPS